MPRRLVLTLVAAVAAVSVLSLTAGCSSTGGEQQVLRKYFDANKLRDQSTVANVATVEFNPQTDGIVDRFSVVSVSEEQRTTLNIKQYAEEWKSARDQNEAFTKEINAFQKENAEDIDRVARAASTSKAGLRGKDAELHAAWQKWVSDRAEHTKKVQDSRRKLAAETRIAEVSVFDARKPIDVAEYEGELISKDATIEARVQPPGGGAPEDRRYVITLQRAELKGADDQRSGRWIVTDIKRAS
jgi:hypothetical protein